MPDRMIVRVTIAMHVRRRGAVHMKDAGYMTVAGEAQRSRGLSGQVRRDRRRQDVQLISQGDEPPCSQPLQSGQTNQHPDAISSYQPMNARTINANPAFANIELTSGR